MSELKRRDLSGLYIFDTFPGEEKRKPTCIEDCQEQTRKEWCLSKGEEYLHNTIAHLVKTFKELTEYLVSEGCLTEEQRAKFIGMADRNEEASETTPTPLALSAYVDFFCEKITTLADFCGVTKHKEEEQ